MTSTQTLRRVLGARSETGYVRAANEDRMGWSRTPYGDVYIVSDGMGGYRGGALAAELTVHTLQERLAAATPDAANLPQLLRDAFLAANAAVFQRRRPDDPDTRDMGATGVALLAAGAGVLVGHVGDSRAYLWRRGQGLTRLTRDHTRVQKMLDAGLVTAEEAVTHPDASVLDRAIGYQATVEVDVSEWILPRSGDMVLLCSDGLCGYVDDAEIGRILRSKGEPQALADMLVDSALVKGGEDNVTVQLVSFRSGSGLSIANVLGKPLVLVPLSALVCTAGTLLVVLQVVGPRLEDLEAKQAALDRHQQALASRLAGLEQRIGQVGASARDPVAKPVGVDETSIAASGSASAPDAVPASPRASRGAAVSTKASPGPAATVVAQKEPPRKGARPAASTRVSGRAAAGSQTAQKKAGVARAAGEITQDGRGASGATETGSRNPGGGTPQFPAPGASPVPDAAVDAGNAGR
jgi:serine/threonine protein phosphatase PrpC